MRRTIIIARGFVHAFERRGWVATPNANEMSPTVEMEWRGDGEYLFPANEWRKIA